MTESDKYLNNHDNIIFVMKDMGVEYKKEFDDLVGEIAHSTTNMQDPVAIAVMLYTLAEEKKSGNLIIKELNAKLDLLVSKVSQLEKQAPKEAPTQAGMSERDLEVLNHVKRHGRTCAEDLQTVFGYRGKNAASARLSKLFHEGVLEKEYAGRKVYYKTK
jgi:hypothetical protein